MFDRNVHGDTRKLLLQLITEYLTANCKFLASITTDHIGFLLELHCVSSGILSTALYSSLIDIRKTKTNIALRITLILDILPNSKFFVYDRIKDKNMEQSLESVKREVYQLRYQGAYSGYTDE